MAGIPWYSGVGSSIPFIIPSSLDFLSGFGYSWFKQWYWFLSILFIIPSSLHFLSGFDSSWFKQWLWFLLVQTVVLVPLGSNSAVGSSWFKQWLWLLLFQTVVLVPLGPNSGVGSSWWKQWCWFLLVKTVVLVPLNSFLNFLPFRLLQWPSGNTPVLTTGNLGTDPHYPQSINTSDLKFGSLVNTQPGTCHYSVRARNGWPSVRVRWLGKVASLNCDFYLSVAAHEMVCADLPLTHTWVLQGHETTNPNMPNRNHELCW